MDADEVAGWTELGGEVVARAAGHVEQVHRAVVGRIRGLLGLATGRPARPTGLLQGGISRVVYGSIRAGGRGVGWVASRAAASGWPADRPTGIASPVGATAQATVVGLIGDQLTAAGNPVAWSVELRAGDRDVPVSRGAVRDAWPEATPRILLFLPGLCETEHAWRFRAERWWGDSASTYGTRLAAEQGWTPVDVRYPSGLSLADNGRDLADLLDRLVAVWPTAVQEVAFVGHSMGGLVVRHALVHAARRDQHWLDRCSRVVCLGTPHGGSPVARLAARSAAALAARPETAGIGEIVELRSVGIRDLEHTPAVPGCAGVDVHLVAASLSPSRAGRVDDVIGDLLVGLDSARGRAADGSVVEAATVRTFRGLTHFDLLNHPDVDAHLRWVLALAPVGGTHQPTVVG